MSIESLIQELRAGNTRALARVISIIENDDEGRAECLRMLTPYTGSTYVVGVTGAPGVGKSSLVDVLAGSLAKKGKKVGVLAVDPSSPFSGGALLGDRIRMSAASEQSSVFIRSMATRGALGGISRSTADAVLALDAAGYEYVFIETVGVGQAEVEVMKHSDIVLLVLVPGMGDGGAGSQGGHY